MHTFWFILSNIYSLTTADNQVLIVELECLSLLHTIIKQARGETLAAAVACLRNLSIHKANEVR